MRSVYVLFKRNTFIEFKREVKNPFLISKKMKIKRFDWLKDFLFKKNISRLIRIRSVYIYSKEIH